ncbi:hypothetical protein EB820_21485 [Brevibacillus agri]|uniref:Uncharacterized protein n=1 Tax=Brevibacillus agri TaxID=51101 RepID=A0A3M8AHM2_9BACL|nr:hypothetical protein BA6348_08565 [Brevibacillus agri]RNB50579.1 hypothetical protein EB820_21485 [Brevibacillus agri]
MAIPPFQIIINYEKALKKGEVGTGRGISANPLLRINPGRGLALGPKQTKITTPALLGLKDL